MDQAVAPSLAPSPTIVFRDGLGERRRVADPTGRESVDLWYVSRELSGPALEAGLRDRVKRLASFQHPSVNHVHGMDRVNNGATLAVISESALGARLADLLATAGHHQLPLDVSAALCVIRQYLPALAALHDHDHEIAHGAFGPERLVITPGGQVLVVDHAMGGALEQLHYSRERYWKDLRVAVPRSAGLPHFDHRVDVMQAGLVALSLILGRSLTDEEYPAKVPELVGSAWAISAAGDLQPLPAPLRAWLAYALQIDVRSAFTSVAQASAEFERMLSSIGYAADAASLERFLARYQEKAGSIAPAPVRHDRPAPTIAAVPRPVPAAPRTEPLPRIESAPRVEAPPRLAAVPRVESSPRVEVTPHVDLPPRPEFMPRGRSSPRPPLRRSSPRPPLRRSSRSGETRSRRLRGLKPRRSSRRRQSRRGPTRRVSISTPRTDFSTGFDFPADAD